MFYLCEFTKINSLFIWKIEYFLKQRAFSCFLTTQDSASLHCNFFSVINLISECSLHFWHLLRTGSKDSICCVINKGSWYNIRSRRKMCDTDNMFSRLFLVSVMSPALQLGIYFLVIHLCSLVMRLHWKIIVLKKIRSDN